jgi:hypothetical protein
MGKVLAFILVALGSLVAAGATVGCILFFIDEPSMPASLIEK